MAHIKGSRIKIRLDCIRKMGSADTWDQYLASLSPEFQAVLQKGLVPVLKYDIKYFVEMHRAAQRFYGQEHPELTRELGRIAAQDITKGIYSIFFKLGSLEKIIKSGPFLWKQLFDSGNLKILPEITKGNTKVYRLLIEGFDDPAPEIFESFAGVVEELMNHCTSGSGLQVELLTTHKYPPSNCEILVTWNT